MRKGSLAIWVLVLIYGLPFGFFCGSPLEAEGLPAQEPNGDVPVSDGVIAASKQDTALPKGSPESNGDRSEPIRSDRIVRYTMEVTLDPDQRRLEGHEHILWTNRSPDPVSEIQLHLYWNAFKNNESTFFRELKGGKFRTGTADYEEEDWGYLDISSIQYSGLEIVGDLEFIAPDDGNPFDETVARVPLPAPVAPGDAADLEIFFQAKVPRVIGRAGFVGDFFMVGQWYPSLGVLEYPGIRGASATEWNCHQYHVWSEFYSDFGVYDVSIQVPEAYKVGATGVRTRTSMNGDGTVTYRYQQADVHDFAWTAWPDFAEIDEIFDEDGMPGVKLRLLISPEQLDSVEPVLEAARDALKWLGGALFPYPYPQLTLVAVPFHAHEAGGMEYATMVSLWADTHPDAEARFLRNTVIHEIVHQYWQGMIATNEAEEPWLDEGFATYLTARVQEATEEAPGFGITIRPLLGYPIAFDKPRIDSFDAFRAALKLPVESPLATSAWSFQDKKDYFSSNYSRASSVWHTLEAYVGPEKMARFLKLSSTRWAFKHPRTEDILAVMSEVSQEDLDWYYDQFILGTDDLDYVVKDIAVEEIGEIEGFVGHGKAITYVEEKDEQEAREESGNKKQATRNEDSGSGAVGGGKKLEVQRNDSILDTDDGTKKRYRSAVLVERRGSAFFPTTVAIHFEDGSTRTEFWDGRDRWRRFQFEGASKVESAEVDPAHAVYLDKNWLNNSYLEENDRTSSSRLSGLLLNLEQLLLSMASFLL